MTWSRADFYAVQQEVQPGDVIAFGGKGGFAGVIKWATLGTVNHVAIVLSSDLPEDGTSQEGPPQPQVRRVRIIESTSALDEFPGVNARDLGERIEGHAGEVWWLPLKEGTRQKLDLGRFHEFLHRQLGKGYDSLQAIKSAADDHEDAPLFGRLSHSREDFSRFFCSELVAAGLEAGGAIGSLNCSEVTPMDLCTFSIYQETHYQLKGDRKLIEGYNGVDPEGWGELPEPVSFTQNIYRYPALLGLIIGGALLLGLFAQELLLGRLTASAGALGSLRELRLAIIHCLLAGYLPSACLYLLRRMRTTAGELGIILRTEEGSAAADLASHVGEGKTVSTRVLLLSGLAGMLFTVLTPLLTAQTTPWDPTTWSPEVWWHRLLGLFIGWWIGWFVLAIRYTSTQVSGLATGIQRLDLLDLRPFAPFVKQGLLTSALAVGALSLASLFLIEPDQLPVVLIVVAITLPLAGLGLLLPMRGVRQRIREIKGAELAWTRERIRRASAFVYKLSAPESPGQLADLYAYQQLIQDVPEWPIEGSALVQVTLYLLIPIASWLGSTLVEGLLSQLFG
jgi:hypothetical protein